MKNQYGFLMTMLLLCFFAITSCQKNAKNEEGATYTCSMHPEVKNSEPGQCPICKMDLIKVVEKK